MTLTRRTMLGAALTTASVALLPASASARRSNVAEYGSGVGANYAQYSRALSEPSQWANAEVWQFGDSIAKADGPELGQLLWDETGCTLAVDNWASRPTAPAVDQLLARLLAYDAPAVIIMATGTNDIFNPTVMPAQIDRAAQAIPAGTQLVWVNTYCARWDLGWAQRESDQRNSAWVNLAIADGAARHGYDIVRWYEALCGNPGYRLSNWLSDGRHTTPMGCEARNSMIVSAVA